MPAPSWLQRIWHHKSPRQFLFLHANVTQNKSDAFGSKDLTLALEVDEAAIATEAHDQVALMFALMTNVFQWLFHVCNSPCSINVCPHDEFAALQQVGNAITGTTGV